MSPQEAKGMSQMFLLCEIVDWLVDFGLVASESTIFQSISGRLSEKGRKKKRNDRREKNIHHPAPIRTYCKYIL